MRLFVGIRLAWEVAGQLSRIVAQLRAPGAELRWTAPESWHITLQFLGEASEEQLSCLLQQLAEVRSAPVSVQIEGLGYFERTGVMFAEVRMTPELAMVEQRVRAATAQCGFKGEARAFRPHITLARTRGRTRQPLWCVVERIALPPIFQPFVVGEFVLFESHLLPEGARYEARGRFRLG